VTGIWRQRLRLWSAVGVCLLVALIGGAGWLVYAAATDLWRDVRGWRGRRGAKIAGAD
jgi:hypothetical protein